MRDGKGKGGERKKKRSVLLHPVPSALHQNNPPPPEKRKKARCLHHHSEKGEEKEEKMECVDLREGGCAFLGNKERASFFCPRGKRKGAGRGLSPDLVMGLWTKWYVLKEETATFFFRLGGGRGGEKNFLMG